MKTTIFAISLITGLSLGGSAFAAGAGAATSHAAAKTVAPAQPATRNIPPGGQPGVAPATASNPGANPANPNSNPFNNLNSTTADTMTSNSMAGAVTNGLVGNTNMTANGNANPNNNNALFGNQIVSQSDRVLLNSLRQGVRAQLGTAAERTMPVHFLINNGAVTLVGTVPTADESQRILARVQQTPGVVSVFNDLRVGTPSTTAVRPQDNLTAGAFRDRAFSSADQSLLTVVQQAAGRQLGINGASAAQMPVHFSIQNGVVGVTGQVTSAQEKAALLFSLRNIQGVARVVDNVTVANASPNNVPTPTVQNPSVNDHPLPATSRDMQLNNNLFLNSTNSSGF